MCHDPTLLGEGPYAFVGNYTSLLPDRTLGLEALVSAGVPLSSVITPEHGFWGAVQAGGSEADTTFDVGETSLPVHDAYLVEGADLDSLVRRALPASGGRLLYDLQDIGARFYTYVWTLFDLMCAAARTGVGVTVLDRPNPLGGERRFGPGLEERCASFVGRVSIPLQHGLTVGELARLFAAVHVPRATGTTVDLEVITVRGWSRAQQHADTGLPWVMPSPNIPTPDSALIYPATCLLEGTVLSEGRGTTRPFEIIGAPWLDRRLAPALRERLPGLDVRELVFRPTFSKGAGEALRGVQLAVDEAFDPIMLGVSLLQVIAELHPDEPLWLPPTADQVDRPPFIDLLWGSAALREGIDAGHDLDRIMINSPQPDPWPDDLLLYGPDELSSPLITAGAGDPRRQ
ncbi:exo-beta-N-acetylmuramidase NamZ family protein [Propionibacteriaceae bacterium Y1700]|uniref:exo-beta-N-acetylmuramidase NamZ family protein n=1 Tax=Microlunatus sp. Y1700 TaxID=3418487 RepID=UPI003DA7A401